MAERAAENAAASDHAIDAPQIAPRPDCARIRRRQLIEDLRVDRSPPQAHSTLRSAPWQLKPAPNDPSHHHPPGSRPVRAACSTKYTKALERLPYSRNTAALYRRS